MKTFLNAFSCRFTHYHHQYLKLKWASRFKLDFSKKEKVSAITVVVVGRNDNYGGNFRERLQATLDWNLSHLPNPELVYIEWNQIKEQPSDCEWITKRYPTSRCFIVPGEIHNLVCHNPNMPMMEYFAKNLGIRQAASDWILMVNADVFIGNDVAKNIHQLNRDTVYGTHYVSIRWDKKKIGETHQKNTKDVVTAFPASKDLGSVVGNFILTHKKNWLCASGYDERLTNARAGVDVNGLDQLLYFGLRSMVLGHHFHLDHPESIIHGANATHGNRKLNNIPYKNSAKWGFADYPLIQLSDRIWALKPI